MVIINNIALCKNVHDIKWKQPFLCIYQKVKCINTHTIKCGKLLIFKSDITIPIYMQVKYLKQKKVDNNLNNLYHMSPLFIKVTLDRYYCGFSEYSFLIPAWFLNRRPTDLYGPILDVWISQIISVLLVLHQVSCARDDIEGYRNRYQSYPRPSRPWPDDRQYGENYGWMNRRGENNCWPLLPVTQIPTNTVYGEVLTTGNGGRSAVDRSARRAGHIGGRPSSLSGNLNACVFSVTGSLVLYTVSHHQLRYGRIGDCKQRSYIIRCNV
ncbi:hypothetical protein ACI65C_007309 [Semiaphis heraclei]